MLLLPMTVSLAFEFSRLYIIRVIINRMPKKNVMPLITGRFSCYSDTHLVNSDLFSILCDI